MSHSRFFVSKPSATGAVDAEQVAEAERALGLRLPATYVDLLAEQDGGEPLRCHFPTSFPTSWAADHFICDLILGVRGTPLTLFDSAYLIEEWGYPAVGLVVGLTPTAGHEVVMLDYTSCGPDGDPAVVYVDEDADGSWAIHRVADRFDEFIEKLIEEPSENRD
jgi:hypothetical protein